MNSSSELVCQAGRCQLQGALDRHTAANLVMQGRQAIAQAEAEFIVDLKQVTQVTSAGIAVLIEWIKVCQHQNKAMSIENLPEKAASIIDISNLQPLFTPLLRPAA